MVLNMVNSKLLREGRRLLSRHMFLILFLIPSMITFLQHDFISMTYIDSVHILSWSGDYL